MPMNTFIQHAHPQALHLLQQQAQQTQAQQQSMISQTHPQNPAALYQPYYQAQFANMPQFVNASQQPMSIGMMGTPMMSQQTQQQLTGNGPNTNNPGTGGMTTPNSGSGPTYKQNNNQAHSGDTGNSSVNNVAPKKGKSSYLRLIKRFYCYIFSCCVSSTYRTIEYTSTTTTSSWCSTNGISSCTNSILST
jgi:hypothetical protein